QFIYDVRSAVHNLHRALRPGGVLLATVPGISQLSDREWADRWCWNFTAASARLLMGEAFEPENVEVETHGNVLAAVSFLHGLAAGELKRAELDHHDPDYQVIVAVRATKTRPPETSDPEPRVAAKRIHAGRDRGRGALILLYHRTAESACD